MQGKPATGRTGGAEEEKETSTNAYKEHQLSYVVEGLRELFDSRPEAREDEPEKLAHDLYLWGDFDREPPVEVVKAALEEID